MLEGFELVEMGQDDASWRWQLANQSYCLKSSLGPSSVILTTAGTQYSYKSLYEMLSK